MQVDASPATRSGTVFLRIKGVKAPLGQFPFIRKTDSHCSNRSRRSKITRDKVNGVASHAL